MEQLYYGNPYGAQDRSTGNTTLKEQILGPLECAPANKHIQRSKCQVDASESKTFGVEIELPKKSGTNVIFAAKGELLYGGQGKTNKLINNDCTSIIPCAPGIVQDTTDPMEGLKQPRLEDNGEVVLGENKAKLCKEIKQSRCALKVTQSATAQWMPHLGDNTTSLHKIPLPPQYRNSMCPTGRALNHPAAGQLGE